MAQGPDVVGSRNRQGTAIRDKSDRVVRRYCARSVSSVNPDVLTTEATDGIAVIRLGSVRRIYFDQEMTDCAPRHVRAYQAQNVTSPSRSIEVEGA
jgi:hypothetical protein